MEDIFVSRLPEYSMKVSSAQKSLHNCQKYVKSFLSSQEIVQHANAHSRDVEFYAF
jgi:hypothetical protein